MTSSTRQSHDWGSKKQRTSITATAAVSPALAPRHSRKKAYDTYRDWVHTNRWSAPHVACLLYTANPGSTSSRSRRPDQIMSLCDLFRSMNSRYRPRPDRFRNSGLRVFTRHYHTGKPMSRCQRSSPDLCMPSCVAAEKCGPSLRGAY